MGKWEVWALRKVSDRRQTFQNGLTLNYMIMCSGSIIITLQQQIITLSLGDGSGYYKNLGATCDTGY